MRRRDSPRRDESGGLKLRLALAALLLVVVAGGSVLVATRHTSITDDQAGSVDGTTSPTAALQVETPTPAPAVLDPANGAGATRTALARRLDRLVASPSLGRHAEVTVSTLDGQKPLYTTADEAVTPASTMKLLTTLAALETLGPDHQFDTTVVQGGTSRQIILVGGGDPLLTDRSPRQGDGASYPEQASLADLAAQTARALRSAGQRAVVLRYDDSLFTGPAVNLTWEADYIPESIVSPVSALWVDEGRATAGFAQRVSDPSFEAARRFAVLLKRDGITVNSSPSRTQAPSGAAVLASVSSAPLAQIVQHVLELSDNEGAEVLLRQTAIAVGKPASFVGGVAAMRSTLSDLGVSLDGARIFDGSGLSRLDRLSVSTLIDVLQVASSPAHPELRTVVSTLPVAGFSGSLDYRFVVDAPAGLGVVRAKTGTLTGVHALAGLVVTTQGQPLLFAAVANQVPVPKTLAARAQLDRIAAAIAACC